VTARAKGAVYAAAGVRAEVLDADGLANAEPELREGLAGALFVPDDFVVYPPAAARWLLREASALGAEVREGVAARGVGPNTVDTTHGPVRCDTVVVAAGCSARALVPELPVVPKKGHLVVTDRYPGLCRHQLVELGYLASAHASEGPSVAFNLQPRPTGQLMIGSSRQFAGFDAAIDRGIVGAMIARAVDFVPSLAAVHALRVWTGFRPATADSLPLIGAWPAWDGMWIAAGHEGLGITTALGTAHLLADLIAGRATDIDPAPYAPDRTLAAAHA
jgi:D-hydroxyproline dehydrogenase subunit beta